MRLAGKAVKKLKNDEYEEKGAFLDNARKADISPNSVGCALGLTINLGNYESLRIDVWGAEDLRAKDTRDKALKRLAAELANTLKDLQEEYE